MFMGEDDERDQEIPEGGCIAWAALLCFSVAIVWAICQGVRWGWLG